MLGLSLPLLLDDLAEKRLVCVQLDGVQVAHDLGECLGSLIERIKLEQAGTYKGFKKPCLVRCS
jgi:hypothetical protein